MPDEPVSRRTFLDRLLFTSVAAAGVAALAPIPFFLRPPESPRPPRVRIGKLDDIYTKRSVAKFFDYGGHKAIAMVTGEKEGLLFQVLSLRCTHQGCNVVLDQKAWQFNCPCHGAIFDTKGNPIRGPHNGPLASIPHRTVDGEIEVGE